MKYMATVLVCILLSFCAEGGADDAVLQANAELKRINEIQLQGSRAEARQRLLALYNQHYHKADRAWINLVAATRRQLFEETMASKCAWQGLKDIPEQDTLLAHNIRPKSNVERVLSRLERADPMAPGISDQSDNLKIRHHWVKELLGRLQVLSVAERMRLVSIRQALGLAKAQALEEIFACYQLAQAADESQQDAQNRPSKRRKAGMVTWLLRLHGHPQWRSLANANLDKLDQRHLLASYRDADSTALQSDLAALIKSIPPAQWSRYVVEERWQTLAALDRSFLQTLSGAVLESWDVIRLEVELSLLDKPTLQVAEALFTLDRVAPVYSKTEMYERLGWYALDGEHWQQAQAYYQQVLLRTDRRFSHFGTKRPSAPYGYVYSSRQLRTPLASVYEALKKAYDAYADLLPQYPRGAFRQHRQDLLWCMEDCLRSLRRYDERRAIWRILSKQFNQSQASKALAADDDQVVIWKISDQIK